MLLCQVMGTVVATAKAEAFRGSKLMLVQEREMGGGLTGRVFVATDSVGAGAGEIVLVATVSAAQAATGGRAPTDAAIVAIVDAVERDDRQGNRSG